MKGINSTAIRLTVASIAAAGLLGLAACGSSNGDATAATASSTSDTVSTQTISGTEVLVDSSGAALYSPDQESNGKILCTNECESIWMPLVASGQPTASSDLGDKVATVKRPDGSQQVTFDGAPLYTFTQEGPGQVTGDGLADSFGSQDFTWHVMTPSGASSGGATNTADQSQGGYSY